MDVGLRRDRFFDDSCSSIIVAASRKHHLLIREVSQPAARSEGSFHSSHPNPSLPLGAFRSGAALTYVSLSLPGEDIVREILGENQ
mmetsp:Transcript_54738/g.163654  ORF Transcript_54738/g.163654 Transcript_54738/m.163654 type:complete len:86 (+) Transcript_54738:3-260(+)